MDEFSNEFLRLENFIEKYIPLRMQNTVSECLDFVLQVKEKKRLRDFEEKKFFELRNLIIEDKGLPNLLAEVRGIITASGKYDTSFLKMLAGHEIDEEAQDLQSERLVRHKHMASITQNLIKLNPTQFEEERKDYRQLEKAMIQQQQ